MKAWKWWIVVVALASGPWYGLTSTPQWSRVTWMPFLGKEDKPGDMAANVLEAPQLFFVSRDPSATDIVMGILGTVVGAAAARAIHVENVERLL